MPDGPEHVSDSPAPSSNDFGLDRDDDFWLDLARQAEQRPGLGTLGSYEILGEIGRGAQGVVYRARESGTDRIVALKRCARGSWATDRMQSRFEREALLELELRHPNIVGVVGMRVEDDQRLLVMEWIDGLPTDRWAAEGPDGRRRPIDEILRAFVKICAAVHFAHEHGVIHRDLKPSNILIDARGEPRVLDFGLAQRVGATGAPDPAAASHEFTGTLEYAAPEQIQGSPERLHTRVDVYALGVVLHEMLTGRRPAEKAEPPHTAAPGLNADLAAILARALAEDPAARYASAHALGDDVQRYLTADLIEARRSSRGYVLRALLRRYRVPTTIAAGFVLLLTAGLIVSFVLLRRAEEQRGHAVRQQQRAELATSLIGRMFRGADPHTTRGKNFTLHDLLVEFSARLATTTLDPQTEATLREMLGSAHLGLGDPASAEPHLERMLELARANPLDDAAIGWALLMRADLQHDRGESAAAQRSADEGLVALERALGPDHPRVAAALCRSGEAARHMRRYADSERDYRRAVEIHRRDATDPEGLVQALTGLGVTLTDSGAPAEAESVLDDARGIVAAAHGRDCPSMARVLDALAGAYRRRAEWARAEEAYRSALEMRRKFLGPEHPEVGDTLSGLGVTLWEAGRFAEARDAFTEALRIFRKAFGEEHPKIAQALHNLAAQIEALEGPEAAEPLYADALVMKRHVLGDEHPSVAGTLNALGLIRWRHGRFGDAADHFEEALAIHAKSDDPANRDVALLLANLGAVREATGRTAEAEDLYRRSLAMYRAVSDHPKVAGVSGNLGSLLRSRGAYEEAERLLREALVIQRNVFGERHNEVATVLTILSHTVREGGDAIEGEALASEALEAVPGEEDLRSIEARAAATRALGMALQDQGRHAEGIEPLRASLADVRATRPDSNPEIANALGILGISLVRTGAFVEAESVLRECLERREGQLPAGHWRVFAARSLLGSALAGQGQFQDAERLLLDGHAGLVASSETPPIRVREAIERLVELYTAWDGAVPGIGHAASASTWRERLGELAATRSH